MGVLGLDGKEYREDNFVTRLFWPADSPVEADTIARQGFWVCVLVGLASAIGASFSGQLMLAAAVLLIYWLGGAGVREGSTSAAISVTALYLGSIAMAIFARKGFPGILDAIAVGLLAGNIRGTMISRRWQRQGEAAPERYEDGLLDWIVNRLPPLLWPVGRFVFFPLLAALLALLTLGMVAQHHKRSASETQGMYEVPVDR